MNLKTIFKIKLLFALAGLLSIGVASADEGKSHRTLLGYVESIVLEPAGLQLKARLDTGAHTSSLHSVDTTPFERDGEEWVRFHVAIGDHRNTSDEEGNRLRVLAIERPIKRTALIKRKGAASQRRYVVELPFCLNGQRYETEFSLTDRGGFLYPALLGRQILKDVAVVDPANKFIAKEECEHTPLEEFADKVLEVEAEDQSDDENEDTE